MLSKSRITTDECAQKVVKGRKVEPIEKKESQTNKRNELTGKLMSQDPKKSYHRKSSPNYSWKKKKS